jgi:hypothetical protein
VGGVSAAGVGAIELLDALPQQFSQLGVLRLGADRVRRRYELEDAAQRCVVVAQPPAEPDPNSVAGTDLAQAGVHCADELAGLIDPAAQFLTHAAEHEPGEHGTLPFAQRGPAGPDSGCKRAGRSRESVLVTCASEFDEEHAVVVNCVPHVELAGDLAVEVPEGVEKRGQRRWLAGRGHCGQHRLGG